MLLTFLYSLFRLIKTKLRFDNVILLKEVFIIVIPKLTSFAMHLSSSSKKRVLFIGGNYYPEPTGIGKYNGEMIDQLANFGYQCTVITSFPYYPFWQVQKPYAKHSFWFKHEKKNVHLSADNWIDIYRCPQYVPKRPTGLRRMLLDLSFCCSSLVTVVKLIFCEKYDYIFTVVPGFPAGILGVFYKRIKGGKFIYHIQDLQIDAASELNIIKSKLVVRILLKMEKYLLKNADVVSSISQGMIKKIKNKYNREVILFPNWVDTNDFYPITENTSLKKAFGFNLTDKIILYSGAIGEKQGLEIILDIAPYFKSNANLKFVICGSGPYKEKLQHEASAKCCDNIVFLPIQPKEKLNLFLNMADAHMVLQKLNAADLVMPSKLTTILSVGGMALISASSGSTLYDIIITHKLGLPIDPDSKESLIKAINNFLQSDVQVYKLNARKYAEMHLSMDKIIPDYLKHLQ